MENQMFCYQCQETAGCSGCTRVGVCGKQPDVAAMQDLLVYVTKGISAVTTTLRQEGVEIQPAVNHMITLNLFTTITNANFSKEAIIARIQDTLSEKDLLLSKLNTLTSTDTLPEAALWNGSENEFAAKAATVGILSTENEDIRSLRELITYGLKGLSAYSKHANVLLQDNEEIDAFMQRALAATLDDSLSADDLIALTLETGKYGVDGMALLDNANTSTYGNPEITKVNIGVGTRPGILVSGHDLRDLEMLLKQTQGSGVDVYTHSEMLPAHYYPAFKKYPNFVGNYGNAWWKQKEEFDREVVFTDNAPDIEEYKKWYEQISPDNAAQIYKEVCEKIQYSQKIQDWATTYAAMDAADAAAIMQEMTGDTDIVSKILLCMKAKQRAAILAEMDPVYAGKLTKIMFP